MPTPNMPNIPGAASMTDSLEFVKNLWGSMGVPGMNVPGLAVPSLSPEDLDKKIADLKAVESWLNVNMTMLRGTIQALEVQRSTLATLKSMSANFAQAMGQAAPAAPNSANGADPAAMLPAATAWWNMLQDQFKQAVSSTMPDTGAAAAAPAPTTDATEAASKARGARPKADKA